MKRKIGLILAILMLAALMIAGCKEKRELVWVNYGESNDIPCLELLGGEYATYVDYRYILRKANKVGVPEEWGYREKRVRDPEAKIVNQDYGDDMYLTRYVNTSLEIYNQYIEDFKTAEFTVHSQSNLDARVYTTALGYKDNYYTVTYYAVDNTIDVTASKTHPNSPHLQKENYSTKAANVPGIQTSLVMRPLSSNSTGYMIQLPNGHFVIMDGGSLWDLPGLLTYMEEHTPEGQIPVVEAWFVTVASYDHTGWGDGFYNTQSQKYLPELFEPVLAKERLQVNGIYYNTPISNAFEYTAFRQEEQDGTIYYRRSSSKNDYHARLRTAAAELTTQDGTKTPIYCPMPGQTYYFSGGLTVDVLHTEERNAMEDYGLDFKATTTCYRLSADGKTVLDLGSANETVQKNLLSLYSEDFLKNPDVLVAPWKGTYLCKTYQDAFAAPVTLVPIKNSQSLTGQSAEVAAAYAQSGKCYYFGDGTVVYHFATGEVTLQ